MHLLRRRKSSSIVHISCSSKVCRGQGRSVLSTQITESDWAGSEINKKNIILFFMNGVINRIFAGTFMKHWSVQAWSGIWGCRKDLCDLFLGMEVQLHEWIRETGSWRREDLGGWQRYDRNKYKIINGVNNGRSLLLLQWLRTRDDKYKPKGNRILIGMFKKIFSNVYHGYNPH